MKSPPTAVDLEQILKFHPSIRCAILVSGDGHPLSRVDRPGMKDLEPPEETAAILERFAIARGMTHGADSFFGNMQSIVVRRKRLTELLLPMGGHMVFVSADPSFPVGETPKLEQLLNRIQ